MTQCPMCNYIFDKKEKENAKRINYKKEVLEELIEELKQKQDSTKEDI